MKKSNSSVQVVEFCIHGELTLGFFKQEFDKL